MNIAKNKSLNSKRIPNNKYSIRANDKVKNNLLGLESLIKTVFLRRFSICVEYFSGTNFSDSLNNKANWINKKIIMTKRKKSKFWVE